MNIGDLTNRYLEVSSPSYLCKSEADVIAFCEGASAKEIQAFIDECVKEESFELAAYAKKLKDAEIIRVLAQTSEGMAAP